MGDASEEAPVASRATARGLVVAAFALATVFLGVAVSLAVHEAPATARGRAP